MWDFTVFPIVPGPGVTATPRAHKFPEPKTELARSLSAIGVSAFQGQRTYTRDGYATVHADKALSKDDQERD